MSDRIEREKTTVQMMLRLYCKDHHQPVGKSLCSECQKLSDYAFSRLSHCKFGDSKPTCGKCTVHCYKPEMRQRIIEIMRYSGPRMLFVHPIAAIRHLMDGRKKAN